MKEMKVKIMNIQNEKNDEKNAIKTEAIIMTQQVKSSCQRESVSERDSVCVRRQKKIKKCSVVIIINKNENNIKYAE